MTSAIKYNYHLNHLIQDIFKIKFKFMILLTKVN